ncbi:Glycerate dehydrogenase [Pseudoruegeria aquimaris]|uniref:Glycerate dehydrogenase n=1 Tax=Pseudoruegeria aquimaris TaxID=393663 RepID=A0A1Y5S0Q8_9RHOB|nr:NAD(P)-dependent oxidoreductase [Pseudoruegeria aquimaris]SLN26964.1 Glycerate dehydrogenase [Pseudoruegeria aquimaris]
MQKPTIVLDAYWRQVSELFSEADFARLHTAFDVVWGQDAPIPQEVLDGALPDAVALISADPRVSRDTLEAAPGLKAVVEVSGAFPASIDYAACAKRGVEVLSCSPGFRESVAEMAVAMALAGARGLVTEHELFRNGRESWLADHPERDFSLFDCPVGFVGFGAIAQETLRLLRPFRPVVRAYDPFLDDDAAAAKGVILTSLEEVLSQSRCIFVMAAPTVENKGMIGAQQLSKMPNGSLLVLASRAHLVDFDALLRDTTFGRIRAAIDVFPQEPVDRKSQMRFNPNLILSPHRAAAVKGGRHLIGKMIVDDLLEITAGRAPTQLLRAADRDVELLAGVSDAAPVAEMAAKR